MNRREFIRIVGAAGAFSLVASVNIGSAAPPPNFATTDMIGPFGVALEQDGALWVSDPSRYCLVKLSSSLQMQKTFGAPGSQPGRLNFPKGIATGPDGLYVVDSNNCRIQVFDINGRLEYTIGSVGTMGGSFATPQGIAFDGAGRILLADTRNHRVHIIENKKTIAIFGDLGDDPDQFRLPTACVAKSTGEYLVLDSKHGVVKVFDKNLRFTSEFPDRTQGALNMPQGMAIDDKDNLWVADTSAHKILQFSPQGQLLKALGGMGSEPGRFRTPTGVAVRGDLLYVADNGNGRIQVIKTTSA